MTFATRIDLAGQLVLRAHVFFDIWWLYEGAPTRSIYLDTMNEYSEFFRFDTHAHFVGLVMYLAQLFEIRPDTLNLSHLIEDAPSAGVPAEAVNAARSTLNGAKQLSPKVMILRSNLFAHRTLKLSYTEVFKSADITPDQLRGLTEVGLKVVNQLAAAVAVGEKFLPTLPRAHAEALLKALAQGDIRHEVT